MISIFLIVSAQAFAGGTPRDFATFLTGAFDQPAFVGSFNRVPALKIEAAESSGDLRTLDKRSGLVAVTSETVPAVIFRPKTWPDFYPHSSRFDDINKVVPKENSDGLVLKEGSVILEKRGKAAFDLQDLRSIKFSNRLDIHWFLAPFRVSVNLKGPMKEETFLECVARATGGRLVKRGSRNSLELDPPVFRQQWLAYYDSHSNDPTNKLLDAAYREVRKACIVQLNDKAIVTVMATPESATLVPIVRGSEGHEAALRYLKLYGEEAANTVPSARQAELEFKRERLDMIDWKKPMYFEVVSKRYINLLVPGKNVEWIQF